MMSRGLSLACAGVVSAPKMAALSAAAGAMARVRVGCMWFSTFSFVKCRSLKLEVHSCGSKYAACQRRFIRALPILRAARRGVCRPDSRGQSMNVRVTCCAVLRDALRDGAAREAVGNPAGIADGLVSSLLGVTRYGENAREVPRPPAISCRSTLAVA